MSRDIKNVPSATAFNFDETGKSLTRPSRAYLSFKEESSLGHRALFLRKQILDDLLSIPSSLREIQTIYAGIADGSFTFRKFTYDKSDDVSEETETNTDDEPSDLIQVGQTQEPAEIAGRSYAAVRSGILADACMRLLESQKLGPQDAEVGRLASAIFSGLRLKDAVLYDIAEKHRALALLSQKILGVALKAGIKREDFAQVFVDQELTGAWPDLLLRTGKISSDQIEQFQSDLKTIEEGAGMPLDQFKLFIRRLEKNKRVLLQDKYQLFISQNNLVRTIARHYKNRGVDLEDLAQEGGLGLLRAVEGFDPNRGLRLVTYAANWVKQYITKYLEEQRTIRLPTKVMRRVGKLLGLKIAFSQTHAREPSIEELAVLMETVPAEITKLEQITLLNVVSLDVPVGFIEREPMVNYLRDPSDETPLTFLLETQLRDRMHALLLEADEKDAAILRMRFGIGGDECTLEEVSEKYGVSRERIRQIESRALDRLEKSDFSKLAGFLDSPHLAKTYVPSRRQKLARKTAVI